MSSDSYSIFVKKVKNGWNWDFGQRYLKLIRSDLLEIKFFWKLIKISRWVFKIIFITRFILELWAQIHIRFLSKKSEMDFGQRYLKPITSDLLEVKFFWKLTKISRWVFKIIFITRSILELWAQMHIRFLSKKSKTDEIETLYNDISSPLRQNCSN